MVLLVIVTVWLAVEAELSTFRTLVPVPPLMLKALLMPASEPLLPTSMVWLPAAMLTVAPLLRAWTLTVSGPLPESSWNFAPGLLIVNFSASVGLLEPYR